ncbi:hypothetical protein N7466_005492 [Penicillium verhagenii]|uniref:uncharacterized protein n=1 Tax=Penicillium verhagenii TaxID=1562060 RepID=UPI002545BB13|nr:uncharacterized protein N7466_005492 [Penicillium verhagenii]KAJ5929999.1 hypothetical protein N7466_005492 [Penicillium verhagenii]
MSITACAMALSPRSAIHEDDLDRYDDFLSLLQDTHFMDMYLENDQVKIDVYDHPSNDLALSQSFTPSDTASQYFEQENQRAQEVLQPAAALRDTTDGSTMENKLEVCPRGGTLLTRDATALDKRVSRCYQFCGTIANCRGNNGCPHCYAVRQGCLWQKWCR